MNTYTLSLAPTTHELAYRALRDYGYSQTMALLALDSAHRNGHEAFYRFTLRFENGKYSIS
jgi:hypothetical protein